MATIIESKLGPVNTYRVLLSNGATEWFHFPTVPTTQELDAVVAQYEAETPSAQQDNEVEFMMETQSWSAPQTQTQAEFGARFRRRYRRKHGMELAKMARWILKRIENGDFTDAQVRNLFNVTVGEYTTLKTKWQNMTDRLNELEQNNGE